MRLIAMQTWPLLTNEAKKIFLATAFGSTSSMTIAGSLPPSSSVTRFSVAAALASTFLPVATEPVNEILSMPGCSVIQAPSSSPPASTLTTPAGNTSFMISPTFSVGSGVYGDGLRITVLPV